MLTVLRPVTAIKTKSTLIREAEDFISDFVRLRSSRTHRRH